MKKWSDIYPDTGGSGANGSGFVYRTRKIADEEYFVNWQEPDARDFVTLLVNFGTKKVYGSALLDEGESVIFDEAIIQRAERQ